MAQVVRQVVWKVGLGRWRLSYSRKVAERCLRLGHIMPIDAYAEWVVVELKWWFGL